MDYKVPLKTSNELLEENIQLKAQLIRYQYKIKDLEENLCFYKNKTIELAEKLKYF